MIPSRFGTPTAVTDVVKVYVNEFGDEGSVTYIRIRYLQQK